MCIQVTETSPDCYCKVVRERVCLSHIEHTRLQLDNEPCPDAQVRHVETQVSECGRFPDIPCTNAVIYMFESFPAQVAHPYKSKFCEMGVDPIFADCYDGKMRYNFAHNCGIGLILKPQIKWRHVLPDNDVVEDSKVEGLQKEVKDMSIDEDVKME